MAEQTPETLNHFTIVRFTPDYWRLAAAQRRRRLRQWLDRLGAAVDALHLYQVAGLEAGGDLLLWTGCRTAEPDRAALFFADWARVSASVRPLIEVRDVLWGFTRPSTYTKVRSTQELDPFQSGRRRYLIVYPFVKTAEWYRLPGEERGRLMAGHIKVGKQYREITQLLLYSFGLQDQEFVVVYETEEPRRFLELVQELRSTEARPYTLRDWPLHCGLYQSDPEALTAWL